MTEQQIKSSNIFSTHIFQPPVGLLMPDEREKTEVHVRERDNKRTEAACRVALCRAVKELENESTIQTTASPSLTLTHNNNTKAREKNKPDHCEQ